MKKQVIVFLCMSLFITIGASAQPVGGFQRRTVEERVKSAHQKIDSAFKLDAGKLALTDSVFTQFYRASDKVREEMRTEGQRPDFQLMREKIQPYADARDKELKNILGEDNYKKFKEEIEPALMPRRGQGGPGKR